MSNNILVSIITPSYNQAAFIEGTIKSVINQTYKNIEFIVVDGNSSDGTVDILRKYERSISKLIIEEDKGQSDAINKGFKMASGQLIGWLNSDDVLAPECVELIVDKFRRNINASIIFPSKILFINEASEVVGSKSFEIPNRNYLLKRKTTVVQPGSFYHKEILEEVGYLDDELHYCMDLDLWLKLSAKGPIVSIREKPLSFFRTYANNKSSTGKFKYSRERRKVLLREGAKIYSPSILSSFYNDIKLIIKYLFGSNA
jgi:glycosyltransferase involved in cell wall biosynthesis